MAAKVKTKTPIYLECKMQGCTAPVQGMITTSKSPKVGQNVIAFKGTCLRGHNTGHALSTTIRNAMLEHGWLEPKPGFSTTFLLPKQEYKKESEITVAIPNDPDITYVLVNTKTAQALPLPDAQIHKREENGKLVELNIILGEPVKVRKPKKSAVKLNEKEKAKKAAEPEYFFEEGSKFRLLEDRLSKFGKISLAKAQSLSGKEEWEGNHFIRVLSKAGMKVTFSGGFLRTS